MDNDETKHVLSGTWQCTHWYPSEDDSNEESMTHVMTAHQHGNTLVLQSVPDGEQSYLLVHLNVDGSVASGSWHETTRRQDGYDGPEYSGAGQLVISPDGKSMAGLWAGAGFDHKLSKMRVYTDKWEIKRVAEADAK